MSAQNALAIINMFRNKGVATVKTPAGIVFYGMGRLSAAEKRTLLNIPQSDLEAALKWQ